MNVLFLTIGDFGDIKSSSVHLDLVKKFAAEGHHVYVVCKKECPQSYGGNVIEEYPNMKILRVKTGVLGKNDNIFKKGVNTILVDHRYMCSIKKYFSDVTFDLILYHTPPITLEKVVRYIKNRDGATSYLLLKDIFPQNALDLGMMSKQGFWGLVYKYFRQKEKALYKASDFIGCMSPANVDYLCSHNTYYQKWRVEVAPNSLELRDKSLEPTEGRGSVREKYGLPTDMPLFIYGGNLGKPQGIDYLIKCLDDNKYRDDCFFVIVGNGTELPKLQAWRDCQLEDDTRKLNVKLIEGLPKEEYDQLVRACDVGLIFLDHRFTIPNYPSRLLSYLENKMPVICATDVNTDIGRIAEQNGYGYWCESVKPIDFTVLVDRFLAEPERIKKMGERGYEFLKKNYLVDHTYEVIMKHFK